MDLKYNPASNNHRTLVGGGDSVDELWGLYDGYEADTVNGSLAEEDACGGSGLVLEPKAKNKVKRRLLPPRGACFA